MPIIDLGDGRELDVPDDASPELLSQVKQKLQGMGFMTKAQEVPKPAGFLESTARDLISGFGKAATIPVRGAAMLADTFLPTKEVGTTLRDAADSAEQYWTGVGNKSTNNEWGQAALRGVGGAVTTGPATAVNVAAGAGSGVGEKVAEKLDPNNNNPLLRAAGAAVGGLVTGTGVALGQRARPQTADVAREALEGLTPQQLEAAQAYKNQLAARGLDVDLAQALQATSGHSGNLASIRDFLAGRRQGDQVQSILRSQPEQLAREAEMTVGGLPGSNYSATQNANNVQQTASQLIQDAKNSRSAAVRTMYEQAGDLPGDARQKLSAVVQQFANQPGATEVMKVRANDILAKLSGQDSNLQAAVDSARQQLASATSASERMTAQQALATANQNLANATTKPLKAVDVDTWISELRGPWQGQPLKVSYPKEQGQIKGLAGELNKQLQAMSPALASAEGEFQRISRDVVDPLKQGPIGQLAQPRGYSPDTQAMVSKFDGLLNKGTDPTAKVSDIRTAAKELSAKDPEVFADAFKGWLSRKVQSTIEASGSGNVLPTADPSALRDALFKDPLQWQGIKDATAEMAKVRGQSPQEVIRGLENLRQLTTAMAERPSAIGGLSPADLKQLGSASNTANLVRVASFLPVNRVGEAIERATLGKTLSQLDTILTSPEGAKMLIELGKVPVMSRKAQVILGTWGGGMGNTPGLSGYNTPE